MPARASSPKAPPRLQLSPAPRAMPTTTTSRAHSTTPGGRGGADNQHADTTGGACSDLSRLPHTPSSTTTSAAAAGARSREQPAGADTALANAIRMFRTLVDAGRLLQLGRAETVARARDLTLQATDVDILAALGLAGLLDLAPQPEAEGGCLGVITTHQLARLVNAWLIDRSQTSTAEILEQCLGVDPCDKVLGNRIGRVMTSLGWKRQRVRVEGIENMPHRFTTAYVRA